MLVPSQSGLLQLVTPTTTPGSGSLENNARYVLHFKPADHNDNLLSWRRLDKQTWQVVVPRAGTVSIQYDIQPSAADKLSLASNWIGDNGGFFNCGSVLFYSPAHLESAISLKLALPASWRIATPLTNSGGLFVAANYRQLVDSPVEFGVWTGVTVGRRSASQLVDLEAPPRHQKKWSTFGADSLAGRKNEVHGSRWDRGHGICANR
jgi:predicted metalloprotease with PDZ domain